MRAIGKKEDIYSKDQIVKLEAEYGESVSSINQHEILEGEIVSKTKREVVVNIGYKSEGIISTSEFRYNPELKIGDRVDVYVENYFERYFDLSEINARKNQRNRGSFCDFHHGDSFYFQKK